jgi:GNAT superfamily N-acetyltransferase
MEYAVVSTPDDALGMRLDWTRFAYAGKFVMPSTGKAVAAADGILEDPTWPPDPRDADAPGVLAAVSFNRDRNDPHSAWLRFVTVRDDQRGQGVGPRLCAMTADWLLTEFDVGCVRIAVNNAFAFVALHKAGFGWTGETTGLRERVLERPAPAAGASRFQSGLRGYLDADATDAERAFVESRLARGPPAHVDAPKGEDYTGGARTDR